MREMPRWIPNGVHFVEYVLAEIFLFPSFSIPTGTETGKLILKKMYKRCGSPLQSLQ
jgi:hypothetical protein